MNRILFLFENTRAVIKAEKLCRENGIHCKIIPVPREISSECGMALEINNEFSGKIKQILDKTELTYKVIARN